ncbi:unnamed protein product [Parascedosporium putredinis]|uniref:NADP-dependent oxidoreductase domain-containing protein n=1 Tax=Parascedosporium putredinis TaxID=1442378 RepID=A0A9P1GYM0_9PEZI|nr:unnamed protein product [Parascedosporium putredinis]CAI7991898.1 unnamed protein product [Parascedosporium putredinis]
MSKGITFTLSNGVQIPGLGFGTFSSEGSKGEAYAAVLHALRAGYRHLDCAWFYQNEDEIGDAIRDFLAENEGVRRADLFITTKVWNHLHEPADVKWSLNDSLQKLRLDYVDLFLVHWPIAAEKTEDHQPKIGSDGKVRLLAREKFERCSPIYIINQELTRNPEPTWRAMEALYDEGKARAIGLSNFTIPGIEQILSFAKVPPRQPGGDPPFPPQYHARQVLPRAQHPPQAYSPLGSQNQVPNTGEKVATNPTLNQIAKEGGHTLAQVLIAWGLRRGYVVLPKSSNPARIDSNFEEIDLSDAQYEAINRVAAGRHTRFVNMKDTFGYDVWPEETDGELSK